MIRSRSSIEKILASRRNEEPVLYGTEPPVSFDPLDPSSDESGEDSFTGATLYELAAFVQSTFVPLPDAVESKHFIVIDQDTLRDGSVIMVELVDEPDPGDEPEPEHDAESLRIMERTSERVKGIMGSRSDGQAEIDVLRVGILQASFVHTIDFTGCELHTLRLSSALDGAYWSQGFTEKDPPPMKDRLWIREHEEYWSNRLGNLSLDDRQDGGQSPERSK